MSERITGLEGGGLFPRLQERYGFSSDPLAMPEPFYPGAQRQHALETLRHLCGFGDMALVLTGARGAGKTRLLGELVRSEGARLEFLRLQAGRLDSVETLVRSLFLAIGRQRPDNLSVREALRAFMAHSQEATSKGRRLVLLLDDADQASNEALIALLEAFFAVNPATSAVPVLVGSPGIEERLGLNQGHRRAGTHLIRLPDFDRDDIRRYLEPRIIRAGGKPEQLLSGRRLNQLTVLSQGSPGRLQRNAPAVWLDMTSAGARRAGGSGQFQWSSLRWVALALVLLGASWWFVSTRYDDSVRLTEKQETEPAPIRPMVTVGPDNPEPAVEAPDDFEPLLLPEHQQIPLMAAEPLDPTPAEPSTTPEPEPEPGFVADVPERFVPLETLKAREGWTIQLVAGNQESTITSVLDRAPDDADLIYTLGERSGQPWFMLVYGQYSTQGAARAAAGSVSRSLGVNDFWVRSYNSL